MSKNALSNIENIYVFFRKKAPAQRREARKRDIRRGLEAELMC
jgi:hypothetical protein